MKNKIPYWSGVQLTRKQVGRVLVAGAVVLAVYALQQFVPAAAPAWPAPLPPESIDYANTYVVKHVVDGDTIVLDNGATLRYVGIDTPETHDPRKAVQCFGSEATEANRALVEGKQVRIVKDVSEKDKYGRFLGYIYLTDGTFVNAELVRTGYAFAYKYQPDVAKHQELRALHDAARSARRGLWGACAVKNVSGRYQTNDL